MDNKKYYNYLEKNCIHLNSQEVFLLIKRRLPNAVMVKNRINVNANGRVFGVNINSRMFIGDVGRIACALISKIDHATGKKAA